MEPSDDRGRRDQLRRDAGRATTSTPCNPQRRAGAAETSAARASTRSATTRTASASRPGTAKAGDLRATSRSPSSQRQPTTGRGPQPDRDPGGRNAKRHGPMGARGDGNRRRHLHRRRRAGPDPDPLDPGLRELRGKNHLQRDVPGPRHRDIHVHGDTLEPRDTGRGLDHDADRGRDRGSGSRRESGRQAGRRRERRDHHPGTPRHPGDRPPATS